MTFEIWKDEKNVECKMKNGKIIDKVITFESVKIECDDYNAMIETLVAIINEPRVKGYKSFATFDSENGKVTIKQVKSGKE